MPTPHIARPSGALRGSVRVPGDKSISHRSLILGGMAEGRTVVTGLLEADDVMRTATAVRMLGAEIEREGGAYVIDGCRWRRPDQTLYCGNAGTGSRLLMGAVAGQGIAATFDGDRSLRARPMGRILDPLAQMGIRSDSDDGRLPVTIHAGTPKAMRYRLPKPSAQIKSAVLLCALGAEGTTQIEEPIVSRDHTERMLPAFGVSVLSEPFEGEGRLISLRGGQPMTAATLQVPGDPSSAAFPLAAALIVPGSTVTVEGVLMNPFRTGLYETLTEMGAALSFQNQRTEGGETIADIEARHGRLRGVTVPADRAPSMIDEYPILAAIAAFAEGTTRMEGLAELKVKESDRLAATAALLTANGVTCRTGDDWLEVDGMAEVPGGGEVETHDDHRIAMSALCLGLGAQAPVVIDDAEMIGTSFTGFTELMGDLGAEIAAA